MVRFENLRVHTDCSMEHPVMSNSKNSIYINLISVVIPISLCPTVVYFDIQVIHLISRPSLHLFVQPDFFFLMLLYGTNPSFLALLVLHLIPGSFASPLCPFQFLHSDFCSALFFCLFLHIFLYSVSWSPSFRSHFQPSPANQPSSLSQSTCPVILIYTARSYSLSCLYSWPLSNLPEVFYCFPLLFTFLLQFTYWSNYFFDWFYLKVILPQPADFQASSIFLTNFLSLTQLIFVFNNFYLIYHPTSV